MNLLYSVRNLAQVPLREEVSGDLVDAIADLLQVLLGTRAVQAWRGALVQKHAKRNLWRIEGTDFPELWRVMTT